MWTVRIRWRTVLQVLVCSWKGHIRRQFYPLSAWHTPDHYCQRCLYQKPSRRQYRDDSPDGRRLYSEQLDWDGNVIARDLVASNVKSDRLGRQPVV